jgi:hypothetical protein
MVTKWFLVEYQVLCRIYRFPTQKYEKKVKTGNFVGSPLKRILVRRWITYSEESNFECSSRPGGGGRENF